MLFPGDVCLVACEAVSKRGWLTHHTTHSHRVHVLANTVHTSLVGHIHTGHTRAIGLM